MEAQNFKIVILGDSMTGKSHLILRYTKESYEERCDTITKSIKKDKRVINLQLWDTAGQEKFQGVLKSMVQGADGVLIVFDITYRESFDHVPYWFTLISDIVGTNIPMILIGHKSDMADCRNVKIEEGEAKAQELQMKYFEASSKNNENINEIFDCLINDLVGIVQKHRKTIIIDKNKKNNGKEKCC